MRELLKKCKENEDEEAERKVDGAYSGNVRQQLKAFYYRSHSCELLLCAF